MKDQHQAPVDDRLSNDSTPETPAARRPRWIYAATRIFVGFFAFLAAYGCALSIGYAMESGLWISLAMAGAVALCLVLAVMRKREKSRAPAKVRATPADDSVSSRRWWRVFLIAFACAVPVMMVASMALLGRTGRDYTLIFELVTSTLDGSIPPDLFDYYGAYPNNHLLILLMLGLFDLIRSVQPGASAELLMAVHSAINVIVIMASVFLTAHSARRLWGRKRGALCGLVMLCYGPLWANSQNPYTDTLALLFVACALSIVADVYLMQHGRDAGTPVKGTRQPRAVVDVVVLGIACGIGFEFKATIGILVVAFVLLSFLHARLASAAKLSLALVCAFAVSIGCCNLLIDAMRPADLPYDDQVRHERQFPFVHWVMMGLNPDSEGKYTYEDYEFTRDHPGTEAKEAADLELLGERVDALGGIPGVIRFIVADKASTQWSSGGYFSEGSIFENPTAFDESEGWSQKTRIVNALLYVYSTYAQAFHIVLLGLVFAGALSMAFSFEPRHRAPFRQTGSLRSLQPAQTRLLIFCMVSLFGLGLFLCGIWEVKPRYILQFAPMLIILGCEGLGCLLGRGSSARTR